MWKSTSRARYVAAAVVAAASLGLRGASAEDVADEAEIQFKLGAERYQAGDFNGALEHFLASNRLVPNRNVLFNVGRAYEQLKQFPDAFRYYMRAQDAEKDPAALARIRDSLGRIAPNVAVLRVETDPPEANVYIGRKDLGARGTTPERLGLTPGRHKVIVHRPGYDEAHADNVELRLGAETSISLKLTRILGSVRVEAAVPGAVVRVDSPDSAPVGVVGVPFQLPPGRHTLYVSHDAYQRAQVDVDVPARELLTAHAKLDQLTGGVVVNADERDALIEIDGRPAGFTPAVLKVPVGTHSFRISRRGFRAVQRELAVKTDQVERLDVQLFEIQQVEAASRVAESVEEAPASLSIVPSQELRAMKYTTLWEALRGTRGVINTDDRGYNVLGFRGFSRPGDYGNRVLVLIDGQPTNDNWIWSSYTGHDLSVNLDDVERIEVVRGPGSVLYGTGAFSGVANLVMRRDAPDGVEASTYAADLGVAGARVRGTVHFGKDAGLWTAVSGAHGTGGEFYFGEYAGDTTGGTARGLDGLDAGNVTGRAWWKSLTLQWALNSQRKRIPTGQFDSVFGSTLNRQSDTRGFAEAKFEPTISDSFQSLTRAHINYYAYDGLWDYPVSSMWDRLAGVSDSRGPQNQLYHGMWTGFEQRFIWSPDRAFRLTAGGEYQEHFRVDQYARNAGDASAVIDDHRTFRIGAPYLVADLTPSDRIKISAAGRADIYSTFGTSINPRVAVITRPYQDGNLKFIVGKAFRAPSIYEQFWTVGGQRLNTSLTPENIYSGEIEFAHRFSPLVVATVGAFANYITNVIEQQTVDENTFRYANAGAPIGILGGEAELRRDWKGGQMAAVTYSYQRARYLKSDSVRDMASFAKSGAFREVPNAPMHLGSLKAATPIIPTTLMIMTRLSVVGPRYDRNGRVDDPAQTQTDPAAVWDVMFSGEEPRTRLSYGVGFYNVTDWKYTVPVSPEFQQTSIVQNGRTLLMHAAIAF